MRQEFGRTREVAQAPLMFDQLVGMLCDARVERESPGERRASGRCPNAIGGRLHRIQVWEEGDSTVLLSCRTCEADCVGGDVIAAWARRTIAGVTHAVLLD